MKLTLPPIPESAKVEALRVTTGTAGAVSGSVSFNYLNLRGIIMIKAIKVKLMRSITFKALCLASGLVALQSISTLANASNVARCFVGMETGAKSCKTDEYNVLAQQRSVMKVRYYDNQVRPYKNRIKIVASVININNGAVLYKKETTENIDFFIPVSSSNRQVRGTLKWVSGRGNAYIFFQDIM